MLAFNLQEKIIRYYFIIWFGFSLVSGDKRTTLWLAVLMLLRQGFSRLLADRVKKMNGKSLVVSYEAPPRSNFDRRVERSEFWWFCCVVSFHNKLCPALSLFTQVYKWVLATY